MTQNKALRFLVRKRTTFTWLVPLGLLIATWFKGHWDPIAFCVGLAFLFLGEIVRFWAAGTIQKDDAIATSGPYALVRNPLYLGSLLLAIGFTLMSGLGWIAWVIVIGLFLLFHVAAIVYEEQFLKSKFGALYEAYLKSVPRLIPLPRFSKHRDDDEDAEPALYSIAQAIYNRENITAAITFTTALVFAAIHIVRAGLAGF